MENNPLEELLSSASVKLDRGGLAACLKPYIIVGSEGSHEIVVLDSLFTLPNRLIIQVLLLASKARAQLFDSQADGLLPKEIIDIDVMPIGSVKTSLKNLYDSRNIRKTSDGRYVIPNYKVEDTMKQINSNH